MEQKPTAPGWVDVRVIAPEEWVELVADLLHGWTQGAVALGRPTLASAPAPAGMEYVRSSLPEERDTPELRADLLRELAELGERVGAPELCGLVAHFQPVPREDWASSWRKSWKPMRVGRFALVLPEWSAPLRPSDVAIRLEPGIAFGTGRHPTTRQCLAALDRYPVAGRRIVDAGTGSGLLAVAAALRGAAFVFGFDIDPGCTRSARELAEQNGVADRCHFETGDFSLVRGADAPWPGPYDGLLANLYSDLLIAHGADMAALLAPGGWFALAGCSAPGAQGTQAALAAAGLVLEHRPVRGRWHSFQGCRPSPV